VLGVASTGREALGLSCVGAIRWLQGRRDLNPQPSALETDALPVELLP
jgi:hypothetical protein